MTAAKHVILRGQVQGVGFRYAARAEAERLGISGWVRNRPDGAVEAEVYGGEAAVEQMLDWLGRGPQGADIATVEVKDVLRTDSTRHWFQRPAPGFRILQ
ncbi:acylphosphatase [Microterricola viridarii]|uniref:Acylphosphatase n=1 Tax=Microterricola viridarii TaxID=412690 RepID=A0A0X8E300_9MICO|nr:acylphosphatase [Microterricola viridarii]AMB59138.1 hypothetical protein AWU67_10025 [Microterricola viridarii]